MVDKWDSDALCEALASLDDNSAPDTQSRHIIRGEQFLTVLDGRWLFDAKYVVDEHGGVTVTRLRRMRGLKRLSL